MIKNKQEIKIYYLTHTQSPKAVAELFNINYRTLMSWIEKEGWEAGSAIQKSTNSLKGELIKREFGTILTQKGEEIKSQIKQNLGDEAYKIDSIILNNMLESSTEELLLGAMSANFIQKNLALSAMIAKNELMKMVNLRVEHKADPMVIACAEKYQKMLLEMQNALYGKAPMIKEENTASLEELSDRELLEMLKEP
ncbi:hypothetical protein B6S12_03930 [Helicobacter valdiviensis]|uniref:Terminase n=1 Tax=Helicobacter valdiviensis TaxID=1458358 RepID=A0A2W6NM43_9HELI|nr:helix-turn-helix domain-containing protein [Helicobacter valdiviensis]PZT48486.1 hypothetical protein B6S12_03930 [Helicobacter valdiviensis]